LYKGFQAIRHTPIR